MGMVIQFTGKVLVFLVSASVSVGCGTCADASGGSPWELDPRPPESTSNVEGADWERAFADVVPDSLAHVPREETSFGGSPGAGPAGSISVAHADVVFGLRDAWAVEYVGDVNADGYDDLMIGVPGCCGNSWRDDELERHRRRGAAFLLYGGPRDELARRQVIDSEYAMFLGGEALDRLGFFIEGLGDVDGDGFDDFAIAAPGSETDDPNQQKVPSHVYVVYGQARRFSGPMVIDSVAGTTLTADRKGLGHPVGGDFNGDGFADLAVADGGLRGSGHQPLLFFAGGPDRVADALDVNERDGEVFLQEAGQSFPTDFASVGDLDGDGVDDFAAISAANVTSQSGVAYIVPGDPALLESARSVETMGSAFQESENARTWFSVTHGGDINGNGLGEVLIASHHPPGKLFIAKDASLSESSGLEQFPAIQGDGDWTFFASRVAGNGDVNGDGFSDFVVSGKRNNDGPGFLHLFYGAPNRLVDHSTADADAVFEGLPFEELAQAIAMDGDFDGDGYDDIVAGGQHPHPRLYMIFGGPDR